MAKDGIPPNATLEEASLALTIRSKLSQTECLAVISTAAGIGGVVEVVTGAVAKALEHKLQEAIRVTHKVSVHQMNYQVFSFIHLAETSFV